MAGVGAAAIAAYITAAAAVTAAAAGVSAYSSYQTGQENKKVAEANARMAEFQAKQAKEASKLKASQFKKEADRRMASIRAGFAASGVATTEGTPLMVLMESASEVAADEERIRRGGEQTAWGLLQEANIQRIGGKSAATQGALGAGSSLLGGASRAARALAPLAGSK